MELWFVYIVFGFVFCAMAYEAILKRRHPEKKNLVNNWFSKNIMPVLLFAILIFEWNNKKHKTFSLHESQQMWEAYKLPQIDSSMYINRHMPNGCWYKSTSNEPVRHSHKSIEYGMFGIKTIEDIIENLPKDRVLKIRFEPPAFYRDSCRTITLHVRSDFQGVQPIDTLTTTQLDSVLRNWKICKSLYAKKIDFGF